MSLLIVGDCLHLVDVRVLLLDMYALLRYEVEAGGRRAEKRASLRWASRAWLRTAETDELCTCSIPPPG